METDYIYQHMEVFDFRYSENEFYKQITGRNMQNNEVYYILDLPVSQQFLDGGFIPEMFLGRIKYHDNNNNIDRVLPKTIGIDYRLLNDNVVNNIVDLYNNNFIYGIRILPEGQVLNQEIYSKFENKNLDNNFLIVADSSEIDCRFDYRNQNNICKIEKLEVYNNENSTFEIHNNIHINNELTEEELKKLVYIANSNNYNNIFFDFYDPSYYEDALNLLRQYGLNDNVNIVILANPLYDSKEIYEGLNTVTNNPIKIHYNTCNDLNKWYSDSRSSELQNFYSDLEASGICSLEEYVDMLSFVVDIEEHIKEKKYTNLEKISYVYDYFKQKYIYDPQYEINSHEGNAILHLVSQKDRMVCEGFSNLLSCILRRNGVPCFTVGVDNHQYNVVKVTDDKYGVDNISLLDITWDIGNNKEINDSFENFLRPPDAKLYDKNPTTLNTMSSLFVTEEDYNLYCEESNPGYIRYPFGYTRRMLELMGLGINKDDSTEIVTDSEIRSAFLNSKFKNMIPNDILIEAINNVRKEENNVYSDNYPTLNARGYESSQPAIRSNEDYNIPLPTRTYFVNLHKPDPNVSFVDIGEQQKTLYPPNNIQKFEDFKSYMQRIKTHFHNMFYPGGVILGKQNKINNEQQMDGTNINIAQIKEENIPQVKESEGKNIEQIDGNENDAQSYDLKEEKKEISTEISKIIELTYENFSEEELQERLDLLNYLIDNKYKNSNTKENKILLAEIVKIYKEIEKKQKQKNIVELSEKEESLQNYRNSGYSQNVFGHYFNIWIDEYDPDYKPWEDPSFNYELKNNFKKKI